MQTVMRMAGHSRIETTMRYYAATTDDQIELVRQASAHSLAQTDAQVTRNTPSDGSMPQGSGCQAQDSQRVR
jgi:hypothetical protein